MIRLNPEKTRSRSGTKLRPSAASAILIILPLYQLCRKECWASTTRVQTFFKRWPGSSVSFARLALFHFKSLFRDSTRTKSTDGGSYPPRCNRRSTNMTAERKTTQQKDPQNYSRPQGGITPTISPGYEHTEKGAFDEKHGRSGLSKPSCGGTVRDSKLHNPNQEEHLSAPDAGPRKKKK